MEKIGRGWRTEISVIGKWVPRLGRGTSRCHRKCRTGEDLRGRTEDSQPIMKLPFKGTWLTRDAQWQVNLHCQFDYICSHMQVYSWVCQERDFQNGLTKCGQQYHHWAGAWANCTWSSEPGTSFCLLCFLTADTKHQLPHVLGTTPSRSWWTGPEISPPFLRSFWSGIFVTTIGKVANAFGYHQIHQLGMNH